MGDDGRKSHEGELNSSASPPAATVPKLSRQERPRGFRTEQDFSGCVEPFPCDYQDERGNDVLRHARWRRGESHQDAFLVPHTGGWIPSGSNFPVGLYRLAEVRRAIAAGREIHVVADEYLVHALGRLGVVAACCPGGSARWGNAHSSMLQGASLVFAWRPDAISSRNSEEDAEAIAKSLEQVGSTAICVVVPRDARSSLRITRITELAESGDIAGAQRALRQACEEAQDASSGAGRTKSLPSHGRAQITTFAEIETKSVEWLWPGWLPAGMLSVLDGDPGLGKSTLLLDIAARVSRGAAMPDGSPGPSASGVVVLSHEDDPSRVIKPRLAAAGADLSRVAILGIRTPDGSLCEPTLSAEDIEQIEHAVRLLGAKLIIIDPLVAYLPEKVNTHRDQDVRRALAPLRALAERTVSAFVLVRHLNKSVGLTALYRGGGSIGLIAAVRTGLLLAEDPDDSSGQSRVLAVAKSNLTRKPQSLRFKLEGDDDSGPARVVWLGSSPYTAPALLREAAPTASQRPIEEAKSFLSAALADGPVPAREVLEAAHDLGISRATLNRAKSLVGVESTKLGGPGSSQQWNWSLQAASREEPLSTMSDHLRPTESHKPNSPHEKPEGAQQHPGDDLRTSHDEGCTTSLSLANPTPAASTTCPSCGGELLNWSFGLACRTCRRVVGATLGESNEVVDSEQIAGGARHA